MAASVALAAGLVTLGATGASAASGDGSSPNGITPLSVCSGDYYYNKATIGSMTFTQASGPNSSVSGGPGVTLRISTSTTYTVSGTISASAEVDASAVIAAVKVAAGVAITQSRSTTTSVDGAFTVPGNWVLGRLAIGAEKYRGIVTKYHELRSCAVSQVGTSASFDAPANEWTFMPTRVA